MSVYSDSWNFLRKNAALVIVVAALNLALAYTVEPYYLDALAVVLFAWLSTPPQNVPIERLPFYLYSQEPGASNLLLLASAFNAFVFALLAGIVSAAVKTTSLAGAFSETRKKALNLAALALLASLIFATVGTATFAASAALISLPASPLSAVVQVVSMAILLILLVELSVHLFAAFPAMVFDNLLASEAVAKSSSFAKGRGLSIFLVLAASSIVGFASNSLQVMAIESIEPDLPALVVASLIAAVATVYVLALPAFYYRNSIGKYGLPAKLAEEKPARGQATAKPAAQAAGAPARHERRRWAYKS